MPEELATQPRERYFPKPEPCLVQKLDGFLHFLADGIRNAPFCPEIRALLLAGGYGRGEGGVFRASPGGEPQLYNDLEFYLILRDGANAEPVERWCSEQAHQGDQTLGIEVEFKLLRENAFRAAQPSMFYYDLLAAHEVVWGPADFAGTVSDRLRDPALIPLHEATRLLFNRGTGLFFSFGGLRRNDERVMNGFIERNHAKVRLALGDAVLAGLGLYHFSCRERNRRITADDLPCKDLPPDWALLKEWHAEGVEFKLHPRHQYPPRAELEQMQETLSQVWLRTFLWLESRRLRAQFSSALDYANHSGRLFPEKSPIQNAMLHWRDRLRRGGALPGMLDYPRAALQRALVLLLQPDPNIPEASWHIGQNTALTFDELEAAYVRWWRFYN